MQTRSIGTASSKFVSWTFIYFFALTLLFFVSFRHIMVGIHYIGVALDGTK